MSAVYEFGPLTDSISANLLVSRQLAPHSPPIQKYDPAIMWKTSPAKTKLALIHGNFHYVSQAIALRTPPRESQEKTAFNSSPAASFMAAIRILAISCQEDNKDHNEVYHFLLLTGFQTIRITCWHAIFQEGGTRRQTFGNRILVDGG